VTITIYSANPRSTVGSSIVFSSYLPRPNSRLILVGCVGCNSGETTQLGNVTDSLGVSWTRSRWGGGGAGFQSVEIYGMSVGAAPAARSITFAAAHIGLSAVLYELLGADAPHWDTAVNPGSANAIDNINTTEENSLVFAAFACRVTGGSLPTATAPLVQDGSALLDNGAGGSYGQCIGHAFVPAASTFQSKFNISASTTGGMSTCSWEVTKAKTADGAYWGQRA